MKTASKSSVDDGIQVLRGTVKQTEVVGTPVFMGDEFGLLAPGDSEMEVVEDEISEEEDSCKAVGSETGCGFITERDNGRPFFPCL